MTGLTSGRTYHFRLVATSDAGTSRGADQTFLASAPPTATTKAASSVRDSTATLNASVNPNGQSPRPCTSSTARARATAPRRRRRASARARSSANVAISVTGLAPGAATTFASSPRTPWARAAAATRRSRRPGGRSSDSGSATGVELERRDADRIGRPNGHATSWYFQYGPIAELRPADADAQRGLRRRPRGLGADRRPDAGQDVPLPARRDEQRRDELRRRRRLHDRRPAVTLAASTGTVIARARRDALRQGVASGRANETVAVFAQRFASGSFTAHRHGADGRGRQLEPHRQADDRHDRTRRSGTARRARR